MIRGLQISIRGEKLKEQIAGRLRVHEEIVSALDVRIKQREGDLPFDVRPEDGFKTLGELENERQHHRDRVSRLALLHDNLVAGQTYLLNRRDLQFIEVISSTSTVSSESCDDTWFDDGKNDPVDGLKVSISGEELRRLLERRMDDHRHHAERWRHEQARTPEQQTEEEPLLPDEMCANEAERHDWRVDVLGFIRDHIDATESYRLGETDLAFGELLPEKPQWMEQQEYEERTSIGFNLERLTKRVGALTPAEFALVEAAKSERFEE